MARTKIRVFGGRIRYAKIGRPRGVGKNIELLNRLPFGDTVWNLTLRQARNFKKAAQRRSISISILKIPYTDTYAIRRN